MLRSSVILCLSSLVTISIANAQTLATKDPEAIIVAQRSIAAMGGAAAPLAGDSVATGTLTLYGANVKDGNTIPVVLKTKNTKLVRVELQRASGTTVRILNNGKAVIQRPDVKVRRLLMNNTFGERVSHIPALSLLAEYQNSSIELEKPRQTTLAGKLADSITLSVVPTDDPEQAVHFRSQTRTTFSVEKLSGFVSKMQYVLAAENDSDVQSQMETVFSDYRNVNGVWVPFQQTTYSDGALESDLVLKSVELNVGVADSEFALPQ